ncbi:MAG: hypothetical protein ACKVOG_05365 [Rhodoglobus sp.]
MPSESELRELLASAPADHDLDARRIIARSRRRRLPRQLGAGAVSVLAVAGIGVLVVQTLPTQPPAAVSMLDQSTEGGAAESGAGTTAESPIKRAPADRLNLCEGPLAEVAPSALGLQLDVAFPPTASVGTDTVVGAVRLTNTSGATITGTTGVRPAITLSRAGVVLWHSNGPVEESARVIVLTPGESVEFEAFFVPVQCAVEDDRTEQFRSDLPALPAGDYELSAAIDFLPDAALADGSTTGLDLVTGPRSTVTLVG